MLIDKINRIIMKKNKCTVCVKVKGKRKCKIRENSLICPRCCAAIRGEDCDGCSHYIQSKKYAVEKMKKSGFRSFTVKIDPEIEDAVDKALEFVENGNLAKGEELLTELLGKHPDLHMVQYGMGTVQAMKGNYEKSIIYFDKALEIFPYFIEAWFNRGVSYKKIRDVGNTVKSFQKVVELGDPKEPFVVSALKLLHDLELTSLHESGLPLEQYVETMDVFEKAFLSMKEGKNYTKAILGFEKVLAQNPNHPQSYGNIGLCYAYLGKKDEALAAYEMALELDPSYAPAKQNRLALLSLQDGERLQDQPTETVEFYKDRMVDEEKDT